MISHTVAERRRRRTDRGADPQFHKTNAVFSKKKVQCTVEKFGNEESQIASGHIQFGRGKYMFRYSLMKPTSSAGRDLL